MLYTDDFPHFLASLDRIRPEPATAYPHAGYTADAVRGLEQRFDGPAPLADRRAAEQADRETAAARRVDPILNLSLLITAAEGDRDVAMMRWRPLAAWLAERTDLADGDYVARNSARAPMAVYREEAAELQQSVAALARKIARLNGQLHAVVSGKVAA